MHAWAEESSPSRGQNGPLMARMALLACTLALLALLPSPTGAAPDLANWQGRSVYFVVTDRFARNADADSGVLGTAAGSAAGLELCGNGTKEWCAP